MRHWTRSAASAVAGISLAATLIAFLLPSHPGSISLRGHQATLVAAAGKLRAASPIVPFAAGSEFSGSDFVSATFTTVGRESLIYAARASKKELGVRTVVLSNTSLSNHGISEADARDSLETWSDWPDLPPEAVGKISYLAGDHKAAMTPVLAHKLLGDSYKWMLYGDDDTVFFPEGVSRAVKGLDPDIPYFLGDRFWGFGFGTSTYEKTPRCVPCNWDNPRGQNLSLAGFPPFRGCPCNKTALCEHLRRSEPWIYPDCSEETLRRPRPHHMTIHGGGGAIFSVGLLRALDYHDWLNCVNENRERQGGDSYVSKCIWRAGFGLTDPGYSYLSGNPKAHFTFDRWTSESKDSQGLAASMQHKVLNWRPNPGFCSVGQRSNDSGCIVPDEDDELFVTMVSHHTKARHVAYPQQAAASMRLVQFAYREYVDALQETYSSVLDLNLDIGAGN